MQLWDQYTGTLNNASVIKFSQEFAYYKFLVSFLDYLCNEINFL